MYRHHHHHQAMNISNQIAGNGDDEDDGAESSDNPHIHFEHRDLEDNGTGGIEDISPNDVYVAGGGSDLGIQSSEITSQLTLSFRGQVFVYDAVTPDKVQAVLLLLGGSELTEGSHGVDMTTQNERNVMDFPGRSSLLQRAESLNRFRQKRKERCFDKKVRYGVRQEVALRMQRNKGQFTSARKSERASTWGSSQDSGQDDSPKETSCTHCGTSSNSTPMMRRGPTGPRTLCNACGLFWANRGTLRDLPKKTHDHSLTPTEQGDAEPNHSDSGTAFHAHNNNLVTFSNGDNSPLIHEQ